jgi:small subunit ribosomal protein S13e
MYIALPLPLIELGHVFTDTFLFLSLFKIQIGVVLRDSSGIAQVKTVTGTKVLRLLKKNGLAPEIPEDLFFLIKKAVNVRKHLERTRKDKDSKFRLIMIESRIHRLARYYRRTRKLSPNWKYDSATASTLIS